MFVSPQDKPLFDAALEKLNRQYDPAYRAIKVPFSSPGYHTALTGGDVHSTRTAFVYAQALLDSGEEANRLRAMEVLEGALDLQDTDPSNATYGIWAWFYEESLEEMSPPDWNWADFCGKALLMIIYYHRQRLPEPLVERIRAAIRHACLSIFRRNMHSGYTNISIMGSFVTMCAGELFGWSEILDYGMRRFAKFHAFTLANGAFAEYNSPTYTVTAIEDLTRMHGMIKNAQVHAQVEDMLDVAWRTVAEHFHAPTRQWAGPHARAYTWLQGTMNLSLIQRATNGAITFMPHDQMDYDIDWVHMDFHCPEKYVEMFRACPPHSANDAYGSMDALLRPVAVPSVATSYLTEAFTLGSFERQDTWNQHRNLLAYWGGMQTRFMTCRLLHDLYDFSSGMLTIAQQEGGALVAASFITDGGDTHCNLDMVENATIRARDLRLRIELGNLEQAPVLDGNRVTIADGGVQFQFVLAGGSFDGKPLAFSVADSNDKAQATAMVAGQERRVSASEANRTYIDVIFYQGEEKDINLEKINDAYAAFAMAMGTAPAEVTCSLSRAEDVVTVDATADGCALKVTSPAKPLRRAQWASKAYANGIDLDLRG